jgi:hypothetical protein
LRPAAQLCLSAAACTAAAGLPVLYVDSMGGFAASRVAQLLQSGPALLGNADTRRALETLRAAHAFDAHAALALLDSLLRTDDAAGGEDAAEGAEGERVRPALLVLDSASALLSPLLSTAHAQGAHAACGAMAWRSDCSHQAGR